MVGRRLSRRAFVTAAGAVVAAAVWPTKAQTGGALQIWFVRHAESEINVPGNPRPVPDGGVPYPLTRKGVEQAKALAEATRCRADRGDLHEHSAAGRSDCRRRRLPPRADADAGSRGGRSRPRASKPGSQEDPRAVYVELARKWTVDKDFEARHGEGESFADVQRRFLPFVREVMNRHAQDSGVVMIVAHAATHRLHAAGARRAMCRRTMPCSIRCRTPASSRPSCATAACSASTGWAFRTRSSGQKSQTEV